MSPIAKMCGDVGAHLVVDGDEAAIGDRDARLVGADLLAVRRAADAHQHGVVGLRLLRRVRALERDPERVGLRLRPRWSWSPSMIRSKRGLLIFSQTRTRSRSAPGIRPSSISTTSSRVPSDRIHRAHLEADDAAADDEHPLRNRTASSERAGRVEARAGSSGTNGNCTDCEPAAMIACSKRDDLLRAGLRLRRALR